MSNQITRTDRHNVMSCHLTDYDYDGWKAVAVMFIMESISSYSSSPYSLPFFSSIRVPAVECY